ncbi:hypothetical protein R3P38DRAFT_2453706, partial [Favolaschia claudopus]
HFKVFGDNRVVVEGWRNARSKNPATNLVFRRIHTLLAKSACTAHTRYVSTSSNPADESSRGHYPLNHLLLPPVDIPCELTRFIVDFDAPRTQAE